MTAVTFDQIIVPTPTLAATQAEYDQLFKSLDAAKSADEDLAVIQKWDELRRQIETWEALVELRFNQDTTNVDTKGQALTIRSVFIIDPSKKIRLIMSYPASTGRNTAEVLRVIDALQTTDKHGVTCPINWLPGDDVVVPPPVSTEDAQKKFGEVRTVKP